MCEVTSELLRNVRVTQQTRMQRIPIEYPTHPLPPARILLDVLY